MRLETYKMAASIFLKFLTLKCDISRTIWRIEINDGSLLCIFHALSFELNLFFDRTCPLNDDYIENPLAKMSTSTFSKFSGQNLNLKFSKNMNENSDQLHGEIFSSCMNKMCTFYPDTGRYNLSLTYKVFTVGQ